MQTGVAYDKENRSEPIAAKYYAKSKARLSYNTDFLANNTIADTKTRYPLIQDDYKVDLLVNSGTHRIVKNKSYKGRNVVIISPVQMVMKEAVKKPEARRYLKETVRRELNNSLPSRIYQENIFIRERLPHAQLTSLVTSMRLGSGISQVAGMIINPTSLQFTIQVFGDTASQDMGVGNELQGCLLLFQVKGKYIQEAILNTRELWTWIENDSSPLQGMATLGCNRDSYVKSLAYVPFLVNESAPIFNGIVNCTDIDKIYITADPSVVATIYSGEIYMLIYMFNVGKNAIRGNGTFNFQLNYTCQ